MNASELLTQVPLTQIVGNADFEVSFLCFDSRICEKGSLYFALKGTTSDGHQFIDSAIEKGSVAVVCEFLPKEISSNVSYILVKDAYKTMGLMARNFFHDPSSKLKLIGVTGTNGKTSTATLLFDVFTQMGYRCVLLSTVENRIMQQVMPSYHTTPDSISTNQLLWQAVQEGAEYAFMEVSSHGIHQKRTFGLNFIIGAFTNITHDHLDYHSTFQDYLNTKKLFFDELKASAIAISNADDKNGAILLQNTKATKRYYALKSMADYKAKVMENDFDGMLLQFNSKEFWTQLTGKFNAYNLLLVFAIAKELGKNDTEIITAMSLLKRVKGRFETSKSQTGLFFVVDYAHTPDALENVLKSINELRSVNERLIVVFGCGGNRDASKRPIMGDIATSHAQLSIITSDNPRSEDPQAIIADIVKGIEAQNLSKYLVVPDRKEAIKTAIQLAKPKDIILIAGKGHENYQEIKGIKEPFDDQETMIELTKLLNK